MNKLSVSQQTHNNNYQLPCMDEHFELIATLSQQGKKLLHQTITITNSSKEQQ